MKEAHNCRSALADERPVGQSVRMEGTRSVVEQLYERCRRDHLAWINGDPSGYSFPDGATLMSPFGGGGRTRPMSEEQQRAFGGLWQWGTGDVELIDGGASGDVAWLVMVEHGSVRFRDRADVGRWDLRVTEIFKRDGDEWERIHRHADPLVDIRTIDEVRGLLGWAAPAMS
jgi:hypothetical protein